MASHMAIPAGSDEIGNKLLQRLRERDWAVLQPRLELWDAPIGAVLYRPGDPVEFAYFPRGSSLVSYLAVLGDGRALETGLVGHEGAVGGIVSHGTLPAFARAEVHFGGSFFRIGLEELEEAKADAEWIKTGVWDELDLLDRDHVEPTPEPELEEWEVYEAMAEAEGY